MPAEVAVEGTRLARLEGDTVLGDPDGGGCAVAGGDPLAEVAADRLFAIAHKFSAVGCAAGIPGFLLEVGFAEIGELIRRQTLKRAVIEFLRPHGRYEIAKVLDELPVLHGADRAGTQELASDLQRCGSGINVSSCHATFRDTQPQGNEQSDSKGSDRFHRRFSRGEHVHEENDMRTPR